MDPELKAYLEAMERRDVERFAAIERRMATKADLGERQDDIAALQHGQAALRQGQADIIKRLGEGFAARKQDEDLALQEVDALRGRVSRLERRVLTLEEGRP